MEDRPGVHANLRKHVRAVDGVYRWLAHPMQFSFPAHHDVDSYGGLVVLRVTCSIVVVVDVEVEVLHVLLRDR
eukprot:7531876-Alexandrium_andersonii.AAC.1